MNFENIYINMISMHMHEDLYTSAIAFHIVKDASAKDVILHPIKKQHNLNEHACIYTDNLAL